MSEYCNDCQNYLIEIERLTKENEKLKEENKYQKRGIEMLTRETEADDKELEHLHAEIEALRSNLKLAIEILEHLHAEIEALRSNLKRAIEIAEKIFVLSKNRPGREKWEYYCEQLYKICVLADELQKMKEGL
jgi:chromosome segregation ATPase